MIRSKYAKTWPEFATYLQEAHGIETTYISGELNINMPNNNAMIWYVVQRVTRQLGWNVARLVENKVADHVFFLADDFETALELAKEYDNE